MIDMSRTDQLMQNPLRSTEPLTNQTLTQNAAATGTMNLRTVPGPAEEVIGWVDRRADFTVTAYGYSPSGALWFSVVKRNGKMGWVYSRWVQLQADLEALEKGVVWPSSRARAARPD